MKQIILAVAVVALGACSPSVSDNEAGPLAEVHVEGSDQPVVASAPELDPDIVAQGREIAERDCAGCHALDAGEESPHVDAPPMTDLLARYDADALAEDLIEGIKLGHEDMPQFDFDVIAADALIAYLGSVQLEQSDTE